MLNIEDKKIEIIEKAVVTYINGNIDFFEAIYISDKSELFQGRKEKSPGNTLEYNLRGRKGRYA